MALNQRRRLAAGVAMVLFAAVLGSGVVIFAMLGGDAATPRAHPGLCALAALSLVMLSRVGEAAVSEELKRLLKLAVPLGAVLAGTSLALSFLWPGASTVARVVGIGYALGGGIIALGTLALGIGFIRRPDRRN